MDAMRIGVVEDQERRRPLSLVMLVISAAWSMLHSTPSPAPPKRRQRRRRTPRSRSCSCRCINWPSIRRFAPNLYYTGDRGGERNEQCEASDLYRGVSRRRRRFPLSHFQQRGGQTRRRNARTAFVSLHVRSRPAIALGPSAALRPTGLQATDRPISVRERTRVSRANDDALKANSVAYRLLRKKSLLQIYCTSLFCTGPCVSVRDKRANEQST